MFQLWYGISKAQDKENAGLQHLDCMRRGEVGVPKETVQGLCMESLCNSDFLIRLSQKRVWNLRAFWLIKQEYPWAEWGQQQTRSKLKGKQDEQDVTQISACQCTGSSISCPSLREFTRHCSSTAAPALHRHPRTRLHSHVLMYFLLSTSHCSTEPDRQNGPSRRN